MCAMFTRFIHAGEAIDIRFALECIQGYEQLE
jgi:hypothetical protein